VESFERPQRVPRPARRTPPHRAPPLQAALADGGDVAKIGLATRQQAEATAALAAAAALASATAAASQAGSDVSGPAAQSAEAARSARVVIAMVGIGDEALAESDERAWQAEARSRLQQGLAPD